MVASSGAGASDAAAEGGSSEQHGLISFRLGQQTYALPIEPIERIIEMVTITPVPQLGDVVEGVINVHGAAVAVVDLRRHLGLPETPLGLDTPILLVRISEWTVGLIADEMVGVFSLSDNQVVRPADILPEELGDAPVLRGLAYVSDSAVLMLDPEKLFLPHQLRVLAQVAEMLPTVLVEQAAGESPGEAGVGAIAGGSPAEVTAEAKTEPVRRQRKRSSKKPPGEPPAETQPAPSRGQRGAASSREASGGQTAEAQSRSSRRRRRTMPAKEIPGEAHREDPRQEEGA